MTTKVHTAVDGNGRPLAVVITGGQRNDQAMLATVLDEIVVPRLYGGRARSRPDALIADRAYSSGAARRGTGGVTDISRSGVTPPCERCTRTSCGGCVGGSAGVACGSGIRGGAQPRILRR